MKYFRISKVGFYQVTNSHMSIPLNKRLKSRTKIKSLMESGKRAKAYPLKAIYTLDSQQEAPGFELGVTVPKRLVSSAVNRNRIKRLIREAWRLHITELEQELIEKKEKLSVMIIYMSADTLDLKEAQDKIILLLNRLQNTR